jgi:short-subunit dehydrogenase
VLGIAAKCTDKQSFIRYHRRMASLREFNGKWALVTGASAGIGVALARELARNGAKLILTARRKERLEALAAELTAQGTEVRIVLADLTERDAPQAIYDETVGAGLAVEILVNNAGLGQFGEFTSLDLAQELSQIRVNCEAMVHLTRLFVPEMVERGRGWVLVLSSVASFQPVPFLSTYAATKGFDRFFALGLAEELAPTGVKVSALCPGPTESEFFVVAGAEKLAGRKMQSAAEVARLGIEALAQGKRTQIPYFGGKAISTLVRLLPVALITYMVAKSSRPGK